MLLARMVNMKTPMTKINVYHVIQLVKPVAMIKLVQGVMILKTEN